MPNGWFLHHSAILLRPVLTFLLFVGLEMHHKGGSHPLATELFLASGLQHLIHSCRGLKSVDGLLSKCESYFFSIVA